MQDREKHKDLISYYDVQEFIVSMKKFKQIRFEMDHPEHRKKIFELLSSLIKNISDIQIAQDIYPAFNELLEKAQKNEILLNELYDQIFNQILNSKNIEKLKIRIKNAMMNQSPSLLECIKLHEFLTAICGCQNYIQSLVSEIKPEVNKKKSAYDQKLNDERNLEIFIKRSGIDLRKLIKDNLPAGSKIPVDFIKLENIDFKSLMMFLTMYIDNLSPDLIYKIYNEINTKVKLFDKHMEPVQLSVYKDEKPNPIFSFEKMISQIEQLIAAKVPFMYSLSELWDETSVLLDWAPNKDIFKLGFVLAVTNKFYDYDDFHPPAVLGGVSAFVEYLKKLLYTKSIGNEARSAIVKAAIEVFDLITHHPILGVGLDSDPKCKILLMSITNGIKDIAQSAEFSVNGKRNELLKDLNQKMQEYKQDFINEMMKVAYRERDDFFHKLFLRIVGVRYLESKILSGKKLDSKQIENEMRMNFGDLIFETRGYRIFMDNFFEIDEYEVRGFGKSHLMKIVEQLNMPEESILKPGFFDQKPVESDQSRSFDQTKVSVKKFD